MKRFLALTALAIGLGAGAASAQKVADLGFSGMDPASGKAPKQVVIFFHGYTQTGAAMRIKSSKVLQSTKYSDSTKALAGTVLSQANKTR